MSWTIRNNDWDIQMLHAQRSVINLSPDYQRRLVWNQGTQQFLIWCILRGQDIPKFYFHVRKDETPRRWDVVDGQQRIHTILEYIDGKLKLPKHSKPIEGLDFSGLQFRDLPKAYQEAFMSYPCVIAEIDTDEHKRVVEQFLALQFGKPLNGQERRQAVPGLIRDMVIELGKHPIIERSQISNKRAGGLEAVSRLVLWEQHQQISESRSHHLDELYMLYAGDSPDHPTWRRVKSSMTKTLNLMAHIFPDRHPELRNVTTFTLMYWLVRHLNSKYALTAVDIRSWFDRFCWDLREMQKQEGHFNLRSWSGATNMRSSNQNRFDYMQHHFFATVTDIQPKDEQRHFTDEQRYTIWHRAGGYCQWESCETQLNYDSWDADHITPHSQGGLTTVENGRVLCPYRNRNQHHAGDCPYSQKGIFKSE